MNSIPLSVEGDTSGHSYVPVLPIASPNRTRTDNIIARIKAKAEAEAAAQAQDDRKISSLGLFGSDISDLSSLSSISTDEGESELELELNIFGKVNSVMYVLSLAHIFSSNPYPRHTNPSMNSAHLRSVTPPKLETRRSTRHVDLPAPNYAKKLELFRRPTPPPGKDRSDIDGMVKCKGKMIETCPLDMLLRDRERERARKARVETNRKGTVQKTLYSDLALSRDTVVFETPRRGHPRAETESPVRKSSARGGNSFQDVFIGRPAHEELLGKESAKAVGKILDSDHKKKNVTEEKENEVSFWCETNVEVTLFPPQGFCTRAEDHVIRAILTSFLNC